MTVLACDPDELEAVAAGLRRVAAELEAAAGQVAGATVHDWSGAAASEQAGRRSTAAELLGSFVPSVEQFAGGLEVVAGAAHEEGAFVRRHLSLGEEVMLERRRLLTVGAPTEPVAAQRWSARVAELEVEQRWHESLVAEAERRFEMSEQAVTQLLERVRTALTDPVKDLVLLAVATKQSVGFLKSGRLAVTSSATVRRLWSIRGAGGERTLHVMQQRIQSELRGLAPKPPAWASKLPGVTRLTGALGRAAPALVVLDAGPRLVDGGGYEGWRGGTTRVLAGAAVSGVLVAGAVTVGIVAAPVAGAVGLGAVAVYQGWSLGNHVYDNRAAIGRSLSRTWTRGRAAFSQMHDRATRAAREREDLRSRKPAPQPVAPGVVPPGVHA